MAAFKRFFINALYPFGKNPHHFFIIDENTGRKLIAPFVSPADFVLHSVAYKNK